MNKSEIKKALIEFCRNFIEEKIDFHSKMMDEEQKTANMYKGAMESRYDTFKEEAQARKDGHAKKVDYFLKLQSELLSFNTELSDMAKPGSVVFLDSGINFFIFAYIVEDDVEIEGILYTPISLNSPIGNLLAGKRKGEKFIFNGKEIEILDVF
jgi:hypothetical protein